MGDAQILRGSRLFSCKKMERRRRRGAEEEGSGASEPQQVAGSHSGESLITGVSEAGTASSATARCVDVLSNP